MVKQLPFCGAALALIAGPAAAQYAASPEATQAFLKGRPYSPYADRAFPTEVYFGSPSNTRRLEPRPGWPVDDEAQRTKRARLLLSFVDGRRHLPVVLLTRSA